MVQNRLLHWRKISTLIQPTTQNTLDLLSINKNKNKNALPYTKDTSVFKFQNKITGHFSQHTRTHTYTHVHTPLRQTACRSLPSTAQREIPPLSLPHLPRPSWRAHTGPLHRPQRLHYDALATAVAVGMKSPRNQIVPRHWKVAVGASGWSWTGR